MKIDVVTTVDAFDDQMRGYAEFKIFSALATFSRDIDRVRVDLADDRIGRGAVAVRCEVSLTVPGPSPVVTRAHAAGLSLAIDRAAARIARDVARRTRRSLLS